MRTSRRALAVAFFFAALSFAANPVQAGLIGVEFTPSYRLPDAGSVYAGSTWSVSPFVVGAGQETVGTVDSVTQIAVDFSDDSLTLTLTNELLNSFWNTFAFNGIVFDSAVPLGLVAATVDTGLTTMPGFDDSRVSFTNNEILVNWQGLSSADGLVVAIDFAFQNNRVPEPGSLPLLAIVLAVFGVLSVRHSTRP
ncbi:MAG: PEP-CTERM sorting domain-containing protein [Burkholderiales bacterium]|jgi:hypothetical protein|nr:PEP-CTERM sorting domain-containing protein [Burkholderiales bacterium]